MDDGGSPVTPATSMGPNTNLGWYYKRRAETASPQSAGVSTCLMGKKSALAKERLVIVQKISGTARMPENSVFLVNLPAKPKKWLLKGFNLTGFMGSHIWGFPSMGVPQ